MSAENRETLSLGLGFIAFDAWPRLAGANPISSLVRRCLRQRHKWVVYNPLRAGACLPQDRERVLGRTPSPRHRRHDFDSPLPIFQNHCGIARTHPENPFSPCSVNSMQLSVSPMLTRRGLRNLRHGLLIVRNPFGPTYVFPNLLNLKSPKTSISLTTAHAPISLA